MPYNAFCNSFGFLGKAAYLQSFSVILDHHLKEISQFQTILFTPRCRIYRAQSTWSNETGQSSSWQLGSLVADSSW